MLNFVRFLTEAVSPPKRPKVLSFVRMNPPTPSGHGKLVAKAKEVAREHEAPHEIVMSHTQDPKKNPLMPQAKLEHAKRMFPDTNFSLASKEAPTILHHAARAHAEGHDHLIVVAGSDRVEQFQKLLDNYNGKSGAHGHYNFKKIDVVSSGERDPDSEGSEGMSASKKRELVAKNNYDEFRKDMPKHMSDAHIKKLFNDIKTGMKLTN